MSFSAVDTSKKNADEIALPLASTERILANAGTQATDFQQNEHLYRVAAATLLPQWLRILTPSPWSLVLNKRRQVVISCRAQQFRLAASWAAAKHSEVWTIGDEAETYSELARATLTHWQLGLLGNGQPRNISDRKSEALFPSAWYVVRTLEDTAVGTTPMLLGDLAKHLNWLATRSSTSSWSQATAVGALAGGGVLLRDSRLVTLARKRLSNLISGQTSEGWFPEASRFDLIKQAQVIGLLGQLYHAYNWSELEAPLRRAVGFFAGITASNTSHLTTCPPMAAAYLFPQGFELLAAHIPEAYKVASGCRRLATAMAKTADCILSDELAALAGGDMLAATSATPIELSTHLDAQSLNVNNVTFHHEAGLTTVHRDQYTAVLSTKNSGAWQAHWPSFNRNIFDPPIALVQSSGRLRAACNKHVTITTCENDNIEITGFFTGSRGKPSRHTSMKHKLRRDGFRRVITFMQDEIRVLDEVWCVLPCQSILLQYADTESTANCLGSAHLLPKTPIIVNGGRSVAVERIYKAGRLIQIRRQEAAALDRT